MVISICFFICVGVGMGERDHLLGLSGGSAGPERGLNPRTSMPRAAATEGGWKRKIFPRLKATGIVPSAAQAVIVRLVTWSGTAICAAVERRGRAQIVGSPATNNDGFS